MKDLGALKMARKARGQSQIALAERSGIQQGNISKYEAGTMPLGIAAAKKLAKALDTDPALLIIHSQKAMMESAMRRNDPAGALLAATSIVKASEELPLQEDDEKALNHLIASVLAFAEKMGTTGASPFYMPYEHDYASPDVRGATGVRAERMIRRTWI